MSGGRATVAKRKGQDVRQCGDITAVAPEGAAFSADVFVECKHLKTCDLMPALSGKGQLVAIWDKLCEQARDHDRYPVLILKQNNRPALWIASGGVYEELDRLGAFSFRGIIKHQKYSDMYISYLDDVLDYPVPKVWQPQQRTRRR